MLSGLIPDTSQEMQQGKGTAPRAALPRGISLAVLGNDLHPALCHLCSCLQSILQTLEHFRSYFKPKLSINSMLNVLFEYLPLQTSNSCKIPYA